MVNSILISAVSFFALCGLRAVVRKDWLAIGAASVLLTGINYNAWTSQNPWLDLPLLLAVHACIVYSLLRMGMVPAIAAIFVVDSLAKIAPSQNFSAFYNGNAVLLIAIPCSIAIYAYWASQAQLEPALSQNTVLRQGRATAM